MKHTILLSTALIFGGAAAHAGGYVEPIADAPVAAPIYAAPAPVLSWNGGYVGGSIVSGDGSVDAQGDLADALGGGGFGSTLAEPDGVSGALRAGYDWQSGNLVYGLGGEYNFGSYEADANAPFEGIEAKIENAYSIFARLGYTVKPNWLAYGVLGYTWADGEASAPGVSESIDLDGVTYGLGTEYRFTPKWAGFAEYTHTDFGDLERTEGQLEADFDQFKVGLNYRF